MECWSIMIQQRSSRSFMIFYCLSINGLSNVQKMFRLNLALCLRCSRTKSSLWEHHILHIVFVYLKKKKQNTSSWSLIDCTKHLRKATPKWVTIVKRFKTPDLSYEVVYFFWDTLNSSIGATVYDYISHRSISLVHISI